MWVLVLFLVGVPGDEPTTFQIGFQTEAQCSASGRNISRRWPYALATLKYHCTQVVVPYTTPEASP